MPILAESTRVDESLRSLAQQSLDPDLYEVVVVIREEDPVTAEALQQVLDDYPRLTIRVVRVGNSDLASVRDLGNASARHTYLVYVEADAWVSPNFLTRMLAAASPDTVVCCPITDVELDEAIATEPEGAHNERVGQESQPYKDQALDPWLATEAFHSDTSRLVATNIAQSHRFGQEPYSDRNALDWALLIAQHSLSITMVAAEGDASYRRMVQVGSISTSSQRDSATAQVRVISGLKEVARYSPLLAGALAEEAVRHLNAYLQEFPERRSEVLLGLLAANFPDLPYDLLTIEPAKVLATLYAFLPTNDTSALVGARRLWEWGQPFDVISSDLSGRKDLEPGGFRIVQGLLSNSYVASAGGVPSRWPTIRSYVDQGIRKVAEWQEEQGEYEKLYSRAQPFGGLFLAALVKIRNPNIFWTAEFSDPLLRDIEGNAVHTELQRDELHAEYLAGISRQGLPLPRHDSVQELAEHLVYSLADEILYVNEAHRDYMIGYIEYPELRERAEGRTRVELHPTLPWEFYRVAGSDHPMDPRLVHVGYFGRFYISRGLSEVVTALRTLESDVRDQIQLHIFVPNPDEVSTEIAEVGLSGLIVTNPYVPYLEFLSLASQFDCLLVNDARTSDTHERNPYSPSKFADYRGSGQPIWAIVEPGSTISKLKTEYKSVLGDVPGAATVLAELVRQKRQKFARLS